MKPGLELVSLVRSPWAESFQRLLSLTEETLLIACPFIKRFATERILAQFDRRHLQETFNLHIITDLRPESALGGSLDLDALSELGRGIRRFQLTHLPSLHAKVFVADDKLAVVTSGNLTQPGLCGNVEYGVMLADGTLVKQVRSDLEGYAVLGAKISIEDVAGLAAQMEDLNKVYQQAQRSVRSQARQAFKEKLKSAQVRVLSYRAKGKTTHAIFSDTIKFLLGKGPLRTEELHPLIRLLHPDLCDDSVDRVIEGVHFGKKWKHYVRNAQQYLKRNGEIYFDGQRWKIVARS